MNIDKKIEELRKEFNNKVDELKREYKEKSGKWIPKEREFYYYVDYVSKEAIANVLNKYAHEPIEETIVINFYKELQKLLGE